MNNVDISERNIDKDRVPAEKLQTMTPNTMNTSAGFDLNSITSIKISGESPDCDSLSSVSCHSSIASDVDIENTNGQHKHGDNLVLENLPSSPKQKTSPHRNLSQKPYDDDVLISSPVNQISNIDISPQFCTSPSTDAIIGIRNCIKDLKGTDIFQPVQEKHEHRSQLLIEDEEFALNNILEILETKVNTREKMDFHDASSEDQDPQTKLHIKEAIIKSQRNELMRYNTMIKKYRSRLKEKNESIKNLEKNISALKHQLNSSSQDSPDYEPSMSALNTTFDSALLSNGEITCEEATLDALQTEIRTYKQIIATLTDENNTFRQKELNQLTKIQELERNLLSASKQTDIGLSVEKLRHELEMKNAIIENNIVELDILRDEEEGHQIQVAELGQQVLRLEKNNETLQNENKTLQKLLQTSREAVINRSTETSFDESLHELQTSMNKSLLSHMDENAVIESLKKELEETKSRDFKLREELEKVTIADGNKDAIMESLTESQQEAIAYLTGELRNLREKMANEHKKHKDQILDMKSKDEQLLLLEHENKLVVSESLKTVELLEKVKQDLSIKAGENKCLQDEVTELEEKTAQIQHLQQQMKSLNTSHSNLVDKNKELTRKVCSEEEPPLIPSPQRRKHTIASEAEDTVMTVEIDSEVQDVGTEYILRNGLDDHARKFTILKKAMKQQYEAKERRYEARLKKLERQVNKQQKLLDTQNADLKENEIKRISNEAEMQDQMEALKTSAKEREAAINSLKIRMRSSSSPSKANKTKIISEISDVLIDGVGKSIELFESMSFGNEKEDTKSVGDSIAQSKTLE